MVAPWPPRQLSPLSPGAAATGRVISTSLTSLSHTLGQSSEQKGLAEQADNRRVQAEQVHGFLASMMAGGLL